ncbi:MAG: hypothetical protein QOH60_3974 [Mycobacterium sp.]|jgi:hypothetical protein|nr:hypothetical protein [Mycobacterium sp.]
MLIAGVLFLCVATVIAALGVRALTRPAAAGGSRQVLRAVAPTQLASAVMLAAGGAVALSGQPAAGLLALCVVGAVGTVAAGLWQGARHTHALLGTDAPACERSNGATCASCTLSCR